MPQTVTAPIAPRQHRLPEKAGKAAKSRLLFPEMGGWRARVGEMVERARVLRGWSLKELAAAVGRDERQVGRWISGEERAQWDALLAVDSLHDALLQALGEVVGAEIEISIRKRRAE